MDALAWHDTGHSPRVSINVSALQLRDGAFVDDVLGVIAEIGLDPGCVVIELTETVLADGSHGEVGALRRLRDAGFKVALDDFGTGYSSLSGLRDLPIDIVKLDRTFITDLGTSAAAAAMVEAVVRLADGLSLTVVAEGVERRDQLDLLVELGCHQVQGHLFSEAVPPEEVADMLRREDATPPGTRSA
jgi:EAL domain-containing protein (putative c-di-GMP-specific phosphodiesterase class I)